MFTTRHLVPRDATQAVIIDAYASAKLDREKLDQRSLEKLMRQRHIIGRVVEKGRTLVGFVIVSMEQRGEVQLVRLTVDPSRQRQGVATMLLQSLERGRPRLTARVPDDNTYLPYHMLLKKLGYTALKIRSGHICFEKRCDVPNPTPALVAQ